MPNANRNHTTIDPAYLPVKKAARWAGVSTKTLQRWIGRGLPRYQAGPNEKVLIKLADIEQFLSRQQTPTLNLGVLVDQVLADLQKKPVK